MALPQYNTEQLIENIKRRCSVPTSQLTYTEEDFTLLANDELQGDVVPLIMSTRSDYFVDYIDVASPADGIMEFPEQAIGAKLSHVCYIQQTYPLVLINLPRIDLDVVAGVGFSTGPGGTFAGFFIQGNQLCLYPNTSVPANTQIRIYFYKRTLALAAPGTYGQVTHVDHDTKTITLNFLPSDWTSGTRVNSVSGKPNFNTTNALMTIDSLSSPQIVVDDTEGVEIGDYISEEGYSAVPQIPLEAHAYLAQLTAAKALEGLGDQMGMKMALEKAEKMKKGLLIVTSQRVDGSVKKVVNPNGGLRLGAGVGRRGRGYSY